MTREEIINSMSIQDAIQVFRDTNCYGTMDIAKSVILKALEQEPILDKIRSEMFKERLSHSGTGEEVIQAYADGLKKGIEIIDKYKGESEEVNGR